MHLVLGTNREGYTHALLNAWDDLGLKFNAPVKSSLSKFRKRVSFRFFESIYEDLILKITPLRRTWKGFFIYGIDGRETVIPVSKEILCAGYRGRAKERDRETYYPRLYVSQLFDLVNEITTGVTHSPKRNENADAAKLLKKTEKNSITLYDRAYLCRKLLDIHSEKENYFVFRCRSGATLSPIIRFATCTKRNTLFVYKKLRIRLIKVRNPKNKKEEYIFATNVPKSLLTNKQVALMYSRRWGVETAFRDSVTQAFEQWHSKSENGILQEFFLHFWFMTFVRSQALAATSSSPYDWLKEPVYKKPNFKLLLNRLKRYLGDLIRGNHKKIKKLILGTLHRSTEKRMHLQRSYPRAKRFSVKSYKINNMVERRFNYAC